MKKISITTRYFQGVYGEREALRLAAEAGVDAVDFDLCGCSRAKETSVYAKTDEEITAHYRELGEYARELGLEIGQTHGRMSAYTGEPEKDRIVLEDARLDCLATQAIGAPVCVIHAVTLKEQLGKNTPDERMREENFRWYCDVLQYAKQYQVKVATETMGNVVDYECCEYIGRLDNFIGNYEAVCAVGDNRDYFTVCVDTGHTHRAVSYGEPGVGDVIRRLGKAVTVLHINDNDGVVDQHKMPYTGTIDWDDVFCALDEVGYTGTYSMELIWRAFGIPLMKDHAVFSVKVLRQALEKSNT